MLPLLAPDPIQVKIDTGAATSSLHAHDLELFEVTNDLDLEPDPDRGSGSLTIARFVIKPNTLKRNSRGAAKQSAGTDAAEYVAEVPVIAFRNVKSSNGHSELRPVVRTPIVLGSRRFDIDLTLADRDAMGYRMLIGRRAMRRRFLVDPGKSFLLEEPMWSMGDEQGSVEPVDDGPQHTGERDST